ncbi:hypothetical protein [Streptomyces tendae]|uniref:hypothetical protein n=1 Tax=Streptomyces tendae TaxID=1932 RepID=UPI00132FF0CA|nr:hypothetical protein [Streptomyces tendae]
MRRRRRNHPGWPQPRAGRLDTTCALPSNITGRDFQLQLTGQWEELPATRQHHDPRAAATHHVLTMARAITVQRPLTEHHAVQAHLNAVLGRPCDLPDVPVRLLWAHAQLTTDPQDLEAVLAYQRQYYEAEAHDRLVQRRRKRAQELHDALSTTPALVLAHWFSDHPETLDGDTIDHLEQLVLAVTAYAPETVWVHTAHLLQTFVQQLDRDARHHLIHSMAQVFTRYDRPDLAEQLHTTYRDTAPVNGSEQDRR